MATPYQIVIVCHYYPPHVGGIEFVARGQAGQLASRGHNVTVVTSHPGAASPGVQVRQVRAWNGLERYGVPFPVFSPRIIPILAQTIRQADVVHIHDVLYQSSWVAAFIARWYHKPVVVTQHVALVTHPKWLVLAVQQIVYRTIGKWILSRARQVIVLNDTVRQFVLHLGAGPTRVKVTANSLDTSLFRPGTANQIQATRQRYALPLDKPIVLFVGRLVPKKGSHIVLQAADPRYHLVFAGGTSHDPMFARPGVSLLGPLPQAELAKVYQAANVFVLPSKSEGFPLSIQEAMASGLPVVTTNDPAYSNYQIDHRRLRLLDNPTPSNLRQAVLEILENPTTTQQMGEYGRNYATNHFNPQTLTRELEHMYATAIETAS